MQIREVRRVKSGPAWEFVRWTYDSAKGRSVPEVLGRMNQAWSSIPKEVLDRCTSEERKELGAWLRSTLEGRHRQRLQTILRSPRGFTVETVLAALQAPGAKPFESADLWGIVDELTKALKKAGVRRPQKRDPSVPSAITPEMKAKLDAQAAELAAELTPIEAACLDPAAAAPKPEGEEAADGQQG